MSTKHKSRRNKSKINQLLQESDVEEEVEVEHELSYYAGDRVKLMKEVLKILKPKKIKAMAPDCISELDVEEINSILLEELLGISTKRLKYIFNGQNPAEDSSSTNSEDDNQPVDIISLDDVSEEDFVIDLDSDSQTKSKKKKAKIAVPKPRKIKKEKTGKSKKSSEKLQEDNLMSVLELLELQARARAIRSQIQIEGNKKAVEESKVENVSDDDEDAIIIQSPKNEEIIIASSSSDSEDEQSKKGESLKSAENKTENESNGGSEPKKKRAKLNRDKFSVDTQENNEKPSSDDIVAEMLAEKETAKSQSEEQQTSSIDIGEDCEALTVKTTTSKDLSESAEEGEIIEPCKVEPEEANDDKEKSEIVIQNNVLLTFPNKTVESAENKKQIKQTSTETDNSQDGVILIVDQDEIDDIIGLSD